jgi:polyferredoxin
MSQDASNEGDGRAHLQIFRRNRDGSPWYARTFRLTTTRIVSQAFFFALFVFTLWAAWTSRLGGNPVSLFLEIDPLVGITTALSTHTLYRWLWRGLWILIATLILGRVFCGWICPFGTIHHFVGWLFRVGRNRVRIDRNRYLVGFQLKYLLLTGLLVMALFGALQIGLLDPICLLVRTATVAIMPALDLTTVDVAGRMESHGLEVDVAPLLFAPGAREERIFDAAWFVGLVFMGLVGLNLVIPRFFCRMLCPLGALLGLLSRFAVFRIDRDVTRCTDCDLCLKACEGAADPQGALRKSECFVCFNCVDDCPEDALGLKASPPPVVDCVVGSIREGTATLFGRKVTSRVSATEVDAPDVPRRRWLFAAFGGLVAYPFVRLSKAVNTRGFSPKAVRPPGSVEETEFLERCIKCEQCANVCPTNVIQPSTLEQGGLEGLWTPVMDFRVGFCQLNCTLCSEVCPTGAIQKISLQRKLGLAQHAKEGPIRVGTAFINRGRCLPWAMETPCVVCEEVCPVAPKAIGTYEEKITRWDDANVTLKRPYVRPELCIGCGICQRECPVLDDPAVYVTAVGETRSEDRGLLLTDRNPPQSGSA